MLQSSLAPYLYWAKTRAPAAIDLAGSNLLHCTLDDLPGAREALAIWVQNDNGYAPLVESLAEHYAVATDRVTTAAGCSGANFLVAAALVGTGDHVLVERPTYDPLIGVCRLMGATVNRFDRRFENGFKVDPADVKRAMTPKTKLIIVTAPHNPSGVAIDRSTLEALGDIAVAGGAHVLVDEVYLDAANSVRDTDARTTSAARIDGPFITTSSLTKSYGLAGLRLGWSIAPPAIAERIRRTRDVVDNAGNAPSDSLAALAFSRKRELTERARAILEDNTARLRMFLESHPQLEVAEPPSASVTFPRIKGMDDAQPFIATLLSEFGVAVAPGSFFDAPAHFRISLAGKTDNLEKGLQKLGLALGDKPAAKRKSKKS